MAHPNWADAKFLTAVKEADKEELFQLMTQAQELEEEKYTAESWEVFAGALSQAQKVFDRKNASQEETDLAAATLKDAMEQLKLFVDTSQLEDIFAFVEKITGLEYVDPSLNHREIRLSNVKAAMEDMRSVLEREATQDEIDQTAAAMLYFIEDTGQIYEKGTEPVRFVYPEEADPDADSDAAISTEETPAVDTSEADTPEADNVNEGGEAVDEVQPEVVPETPETSSFDNVFDSGDALQAASDADEIFSDM